MPNDSRNNPTASFLVFFIVVVVIVVVDSKKLSVRALLYSLSLS
jgi:hypothetical protein